MLIDFGGTPPAVTVRVDYRARRPRGRARLGPAVPTRGAASKGVNMDRTAVGYFRTRADADRAYEELDRAGFDRDELSVIGRGAEGRKGLMDDDDHVGPGEGAAVGGIAGLLLGAAAMLIPGIGPIVAIGPITAALTGAVTGGVTGAVVGGVSGALIKAGVPEDEARFYEDRFRS